MKTYTFAELTTSRRALLEAAETAMGNAYCPYSNFAVGAALLTDDGEVVAGANVENAAYGSTICAERSALVAANAMGYRVFEAIAIIGGPKDGDAHDPSAPCGACRQMLFEFSELAGQSMEVIFANSDKSRVVISDLEQLLPLGFGPDNLL